MIFMSVSQRNVRDMPGIKRGIPGVESCKCIGILVDGEGGGWARYARLGSGDLVIG